MREKNIRIRNEYVQFVMAVNEDPTRRIVYMNESYIKRSINVFLISFDPIDEQDMQVNAMKKRKDDTFSLLPLSMRTKHCQISQRKRNEKLLELICWLKIWAY